MKFSEYKATRDEMTIEEGLGKFITQMGDKALTPVDPQDHYVTGKSRNAVADLVRKLLSVGVGGKELLVRLAKAGIDAGSAPFQAVKAAMDVHNSKEPVSLAFGTSEGVVGEGFKKWLGGIDDQDKETKRQEVEEMKALSKKHRKKNIGVSDDFYGTFARAAERT